jgi:hypothetical protein
MAKQNHPGLALQSMWEQQAATRAGSIRNQRKREQQDAGPSTAPPQKKKLLFSWLLFPHQ